MRQEEEEPLPDLRRIPLADLAKLGRPHIERMVEQLARSSGEKYTAFGNTP